MVEAIAQARPLELQQLNSDPVWIGPQEKIIFSTAKIDTRAAIDLYCTAGDPAVVAGAEVGVRARVGGFTHPLPDYTRVITNDAAEQLVMRVRGIAADHLEFWVKGPAAMGTPSRPSLFRGNAQGQEFGGEPIPPTLWSSLSAAAAPSGVVSTVRARLHRLEGITLTSNDVIQIFDATALPAPGTVPAFALSTLSTEDPKRIEFPRPIMFVNGIVWATSTTAATFVGPSGNAFVRVEYQLQG
jgi:hypothetical protein